MNLQTQTLTRPAPARVLACGAWLKNTACLVDGTRVHWSSLHGDLSDPDRCTALDASVEHLLSLASGPIAAVAHDLHPDFHSSRVAQAVAQRLGVPAVAVQHHHAHIAAVQAEHGLHEPVIGLALDGVGYGTDSLAWGGELLWLQGSAPVAPGAPWQRLGHLHPLAMPGADAAAREPWRMAAAGLHALGRGGEIEARLAPLVGEAAARVVHALLERGVQCPRTTSAGRWFDAAAGVLSLAVPGLGSRQAYEAQAAMALEQAASAWLADNDLLAVESDAPLSANGGLDLRPVLTRLLNLVDGGSPDVFGHGAALFHVTLADGLARWATRAAREHQVQVVALGGGCFLNRMLVQRLLPALQRHSGGLRVLQPQAVSCGDAGLALGQAWAAAHGVSQHQDAASEVHPCA